MAVMEASASSEKRRLRMAERAPCSPGCHSCCFRMVEITVAEAAVMVFHLRASGGWKRVRAASSSLAVASREMNADTWFKSRTRCPVLSEDGTCSAYAVRPPACSAHLVTSSPDACDPWSSEPEYAPVDLSAVYLEAHAAISRAVPPGGIMSMSLPIPLALLLADRVAIRTDLTLEQALEIIARET